MADKKLNEVTKVTDMAYVPVIMSDGSIGQIAKADLASVVAEQMNKSLLFPYMERGSLSSVDLNTIRELGSYAADTSCSNRPGFDNFSSGTLVLICLSLTNTFQIAVRPARNAIAVRVLIIEGSWTDWREI